MLQRRRAKLKKIYLSIRIYIKNVLSIMPYCTSRRVMYVDIRSFFFFFNIYSNIITFTVHHHDV